MHARMVGFAVWCLSALAWGQNLEVIVVPAVPLDATAPHFAVNGRGTTFKAIARGGNGTYFYEWDFQGDDTYDFGATTTNRYRLDTRFTYPNQVSDTVFNAKIRVTSNGQTVTATYPVRVFADVPLDPNNANQRQLQVLRVIVIENALWSLHNQMTRSGNEADPLTGAQIIGALPGTYVHVAGGGFLEALARHGRLPAFPPAAVGPIPRADNAARWATDPFAEDAYRVLNGMLNGIQVASVTPADEANDTGFYPTVTRTPIPGTDDGIGLTLGWGTDQSNAGNMALLRALSFARLKGFTAQVGDQNRVLGRSFEFIAQQLVDGLVWAQNESGTYPGAWWYQPNGTSDLGNELGQGGMDAVQALWSVDTYLRDDGVIVPNLARARASSYAIQALKTCAQGGSGFAYFATSGCDLAQSYIPAFIFAWDGAPSFSTSDNRLAFPGFALPVNPTRGILRSNYNNVLTFLTNTFPNGQPNNNQAWDLGYVVGGNFGRIDGMGDFFTMMHLMRLARAHEPELTTLASQDFYRSITRFMINHQLPSGDFLWAMSLGANNDNNFGSTWRTVAAALILSPDDMQPVPTLSATVDGGTFTTVAEGTPITFTGQGNVAAAVTHVWTMGNGDSRTGALVTYAYPDDGLFNAVDTVTTDAGTVGVDLIPLAVTNVAPRVDAGPDVTVDEGATVSFRGSFVDPGSADTWTLSWNFGDGTILPAALAAPHTYPDEGTFNATLTVTDDDLGVGTDFAVITVRNVAPVVTSSPPTVVSQGSTVTYTLTFTDPGTTDTHVCSAMTAPMNAMLMGCALSWTPTAAQVGTQAFSLCVTDNDNGQTCQSFSVIVVPAGANLPPTAPRLDSPAFDARVMTLQPTLAVTNATDPEGDPLTYEFEVLLRGARVANQANVAPGAATTSWQVATALAEDTTYTWRARAVAAQGAGPWSDLGQFTVNATNTPPPTVTLLTPADEALVRTLTPTLTFLAWPDADGDALVFDWQVAADEQFTTSLASATGISSNQIALTMPLTEDSRACWRVRSDDGQVKSAWVASCFRVSAVDGPPSTVTHLSPAAGATVATLNPVFAWTPATDPEGQPLTYELVVSEGMTTLATVSTGGTAAVLAQALTDGRSYQWKVRALTTSGPAGAFSTETSFTVQLPDAGVAMGGGSAGGGAAGGGAAGGGAAGGGAAGGGAAGGGVAGGGVAGGGSGGGATAGGQAAGGSAGGTTETPKSGCGCTAPAGGDVLGLAILMLVRRRAKR